MRKLMRTEFRNLQLMEKNSKQQNIARNPALRIAVTAMFAALLSGGKLALAAVPNVEIVTITIAVCAFVWGLSYALPATLVFVTCDIFIWGFNTWVISYYVYWPLVAVTFWLLGKARFKHAALKVVCVTAAAVVLTALFGVITSAVDTLIGYGGGEFWIVPENFFYRFSVMYVRGVVYFLLQIVCNLVLFAVAFLPLEKLNRKMKLKLFPDEGKSVVINTAPIPK